LFHSTTFPDTRASDVNQTAIYFNPKLDAVHIADVLGREFNMLTQCKATVRSIRMLVIGGRLFPEDLRRYVALSLFTFESLETLILVVEGETARNEEEWIRENMADHLVKARDRLRPDLDGKGRRVEWELPAVKVMDAQALESQLWL
jgi:hypothetical protein